MKRHIIAFAVLIGLASCGGGSESGFVFKPDYPEKLQGFVDGMKARATLVSADGSSFLSAPSEGELEDDGWHFNLNTIYQSSERLKRLRVEFLHALEDNSKSQATANDLILCFVLLPISSLGGEVLRDPGGDAYDFSSDYDSDGLANIDELLTGVNPAVSDTDGDGVPDGADFFPSVSGEWGDMDGDGIGDNSDDDIDGDGLLNDDELLFGTDPRVADTDGDGHLDSTDLCPLVADPDQDDFDGDASGDACDDDSDGDGLSDQKELGVGTDPLNIDTDGDGLGDGTEVAWGTNPLDSDTDDDGVNDKSDDCPKHANGDQSDVDGDGAGDACDLDLDGDGVSNGSDNCPDGPNSDQWDRDGDIVGDACDVDIDGDGIVNGSDNCPLAANPAQDGDDADEDGMPADCDLDDGDVGVGTESDAVFVDIAHGSDSNSGMIFKPLATISAAVHDAVSKGLSVYVAAGEYDVSGLEIPNGSRIYGGFSNGDEAEDRFASRDVRSDDPAYRTLLKRGDISTTLILAAKDIVVNGFHIENCAATFDPVEPSAAMDIVSGSAVIEKNVVNGNEDSSDSVGIRIRNGGASLFQNRIHGGGFDALGSRSVGLLAEGGSVVATNNIVIAGSGRFASGARIENCDVKAINNTIDARSGNDVLGVSEGIVFKGASPIFVNNLIFTATAPDQYPLLCWGGMPTSESKFLNNLLANFSGDESASIAVGCDGMAYVGADFSMGDAVVLSNAKFDGEMPGDLIDSVYGLVGSGGSNDGLDDGLNAGVAEFGDVTLDFNGTARPKGLAYDVGAMEK